MGGIRVKMGQTSKVLGFFRNQSRNVLRVEIHLPENILSEKIIYAVLDRLENSKNARKIGGIELRTRLCIFGGHHFGSK
jgi:hypothetical protein